MNTAKGDDDNENDGHDPEFRVERDEILLLARLRIIRLLVVIYLFRFGHCEPSTLYAFSVYRAIVRHQLIRISYGKADTLTLNNM